MPKIKSVQQNSESGFALLITLVVVTVLISIGLSVLDLSVRQVRLAGNAKDSEIAFHAANAGVECASYWRRNEDSGRAQENGEAFSPSCFGNDSLGAVGPNVSGDMPDIDDISDGEAYLYQFKFDWGGVGDQRCSQINLLVASSSLSGNGMVITNMDKIMPGYPNGTDKTCGKGEKCAVVSVQGYNKQCGSINTYGTVQREVLLQL